MKLRIAVALFAVSVASGSLRAETIDRVLAVVANQLITLSDVTAATDPISAAQSLSGESGPGLSR